MFTYHDIQMFLFREKFYAVEAKVPFQRKLIMSFLENKNPNF